VSVHEEVYQIVYRTEVERAIAGVDALKKGVIDLGMFAGAAATDLKEMGKSSQGAARDLGSLVKAIDTLKTKRQDLAGIEYAFTGIAGEVADAKSAIAGMVGELQALKGKDRDVGRIEYAVKGLAGNAGGARLNVQGLGLELDNLGKHRASVDGVRDSVEGVQRKAYGARKNVEELGLGLSGLGGKAAGVAGLGASLGGVRKGFGGAAAGGRRLGMSIDGLIARVAGIQAIRGAVQDLGNALKDARKSANEGGRKNLKTRDHYRELANLQGKPSPDNEVVGGAMRFRLATGLDDRAANDALRRFEGGLPTAIAKGNVSGSSTSGMAGDFFREAARTGLRVDVKGGTSGLLASKIAQTAKLTSADQGVDKFATILDVLNRGDGDLDPLVQGLVKGAGGMVGPGMAFNSLEEFAAAQRVTSLNASPQVSGTRVRQAFSGLQRLLAQDGKDGKPKSTLGLKVGDFAGNIDKLAPLLEGKENQDQALHDAGLANQAERRALLQLYANRQILRDETAAVKAGTDPGKVKGLNDRFFASDTAHERIAAAQKDAAEFAQHARDEPTAVFRDKAEANLRGRLQLDTPDSNLQEAAADSPIARTMGSVAEWVLRGGKVRSDLLPIWLGGKPARDIKIDVEAERIAKEQAGRVGINAGVEVDRRFGGIETTPDDRLPEVAAAVRARGGDPFGGAAGTDALLRQLIREVQDQTKVIQKGPPAPFLPNNNAPQPPAAGVLGWNNAPWF
jgi:hypothetical protein